MKNEMNGLDNVPMSNEFKNLLTNLIPVDHVLPIGADVISEIVAGMNMDTMQPTFVYLLDGVKMVTTNLGDVDTTKRKAYIIMLMALMSEGSMRANITLTRKADKPDMTGIDELLNNASKN